MYCNAPGALAKPSTRQGLILILALAVLVVCILVVGTTEDRKTQREASVQSEIDVKKLASVSRAEVERLFGSPMRYEMCCSTDNDPPFEIAYYQWGDIDYNEHGNVADVRYRYKKHPHSLESALAKVGLRQTSEPLRVGHLYNWCPKCVPSSPALFNDDLKLGVTIFDDPKGDGFSTIWVAFLPLD